VVESLLVREIESEGKLPLVGLARLAEVAQVGLLQITREVWHIGVFVYERFVLCQHADNLTVVVVRQADSLEIDLELHIFRHTAISLGVSKSCEVCRWLDAFA